MLSEEQIQRYSRQILLKELGGRGQQRLLSTPIEVEGSSPALDVAVAFLAASGTPLVDRAPERAGFVHGVTLASFAPDAARHVDAAKGWLGPPDAVPDDRSRFRVVVSPQGLIGAPAGLDLPASHQPPPAEGCDAVALGALAALTVQRYALGLEALALVVAFVDGRWQRLT